MHADDDHILCFIVLDVCQTAYLLIKNVFCAAL